MAIRVLFGKAGSGKTERCFSEIKAWAEGGGKAILLVPDQATFGIERRFAAAMPGNGFAGIQVVGFSRLAYRVFQERGKEHQSLSELARQIVIQRLLRKHSDELTVLQTAAGQPNFVQTVGQFIWECRSFCISPDDLRQAAAGMEGQTLSQKLQDIAVLYDGYTDFLKNRYGSADDVMTLLAQEIKDYQFLKGARVWIDGFHWFTPQQMDILRAAAGAAESLTVTLTMDPQELSRQNRETALFHRSYEVYEQLRQLFPQLETEAVPDTATGSMKTFADAFFQIVPQQMDNPVEGLSVLECTNKTVEIDAVARRILKFSQQGYRYRDMLVLTRTSDSYTSIVERLFRFYNIPCFTDYRRPMMEHPAAEAILSVLEILRSRFAYEPLFRLLKTDLFPLQRQEVDDLENYCLEHGIQGYHWLQKKDWTYGSMRFTDDGPVADAVLAEKVARINDIRNKVMAVLQPFYETATTEHTVREWCTLLYQWLEEIDVPAALRQWKADDDATGHTMEGKEHEQIWKQIQHLLDELVLLCGDETIDLEEFSQMLEDGLGDLKFSIIPPTLDHVTITSIERGYTMQGKIVFLCGINDGVFPQHSTDAGLLNDLERQHLGELGLALGPGSRFRSFQERFWFYIACTRSLEKLILTYSLADEKGDASEPSTWIGQIRDKNYITGIETEKGVIEAGKEQDFILSLPASLRYLPAMLRPAVEGQPISDIWWGLYDWAGSHGYRQQTVQSVQGLFHCNAAQNLPADLVRALYAPKGQLRGSVTKFELYNKCPFAYFSQYGLGLAERKVYRFAAPDLGTLVHRALRLIGNNLLAEGKQWRDIAPDMVEERCRAATEELAPQIQDDILMSNAYYGSIKERLIRTLTRTVQRLCEFSKVSDFQMMALEKSFGRGSNDWEPVRFTLPDGLEVVITGQVDRVDMLDVGDKKFVIVIDYKSGNNKMDLREVYAGLELQLLTYMSVTLLNLGEEALPAAILYCHVRDDKATESQPVDDDKKKEVFKKNSKMNGFFLESGAVMKSLDKSLNGFSTFMNLRLLNSGAISKKDGVTYDEAQWKGLLALTNQRVQEIAGRLAKGNIDIYPARNKKNVPCSYCAYHGICSFDQQLPDNNYRMLTALGVDKIVKQMTQEGGGDNGMDKGTTGSH